VRQIEHARNEEQEEGERHRELGEALAAAAPVRTTRTEGARAQRQALVGSTPTLQGTLYGSAMYPPLPERRQRENGRKTTVEPST